MKGVSKAVAKLCALSTIVLLLSVQPALAAPKATAGDRGTHSIIRTILKRILDLTDISFPPG